jgi:hypothetical protein
MVNLLVKPAAQNTQEAISSIAFARMAAGVFVWLQLLAQCTALF